MTTRILLAAISILLPAAAAPPSLVTFAALPPAILPLLGPAASAGRFPAWIETVDRRAAERLREGEQEALVYYVLQGRKFTSLAALEPAAIANQNNSTAALNRWAEFHRACASSDSKDERLRYFCAMRTDEAAFQVHLRRTLAFLRDKEIQSKRWEGERRREFIAGLYRERGLSTDASLDANYPVALAIQELTGDVARVLIIGPGLDFAPRTALDDSVPPQSFQPYAVADALLKRGLKRPLEIHCIDINPRVVDHLRASHGKSVILQIPERAGTPELERYRAAFGANIGKAGGRTVTVSPEVSARITAEELNIVTHRPSGRAPFDLVIATNIFVYLEDAELALAIANIASLVRDGGYLVHNESRAVIEAAGQAAALPIVNARMVRLVETSGRALYDTQVIHRKGNGE